MSLAAGTRLGPYEIAEAIGSGGMGEVYRAKDTTLGRDVAIKVLPESLVNDASRVARFEQEAKTLAALNHPNIAHIYGLERGGGTTALVMELVAGATIAERIEQGPLPADEALNIAFQIADALEAAHERGIVHRDLKPANIKLKPDGTVKVLDFGIAKAFDPLASMSGPKSPVMTTPVTQAGIILGTAAYMSPEQARGKGIDQRTDIWAFACVLYEMLTGQPAFGGEDVPITLARVLASDTDMNTLPAMISPAVRQTLRLCLQKDPKQRVADIRDVRLALKGAFDTTSIVRPAFQAWQRPVPLGIGAVLFIAVTAVGVWMLEPEISRPTTRTLITPPEGMPFLANNVDVSLVISPDGRRVVYRGALEGQPRLFVRDLSKLDAVPLTGFASDARNLFLSPDGNWVGFSNGADLYRASIQGGPPVMIVEALDGFPRGAAWGPDDTIVFATSGPRSGLRRIAAGGGAPEDLTMPEEGADHVWPEYLPGGEAVLFTIVNADGELEAAQIAVLSLASSEHKVLIAAGTNPRYVLTGHIVYSVGGTLRAVGFDRDRLEVTTDPIPVVEDVATTRFGAANFGISQNGSLVYVRGSAGTQLSLVWMSRDGREEPLPLVPADYSWPRLSPDGAQVTLTIDNQDVWVADIARGTVSRVTTTAGVDNVPIWTRDGERLVYASLREQTGRFSFFAQRADGTGSAEKLLTSEATGNFKPYAWSPDGTRLVFDYGSPPALDVGVGTLGADGTWEPLLNSEANEAAPALSPDGNWIAYSSDQTGRCEIYVERFPDLGNRRQISTAGGAEAVWSHDGHELFYREGARLMTVSIDTGLGFAAGTPEVVLDGMFGPPSCLSRNYDVSPDGQRFLVVQPAGGRDAETTQELVLVQNWFEELERLVPVR